MITLLEKKSLFCRHEADMRNDDEYEKMAGRDTYILICRHAVAGGIVRAKKRMHARNHAF